MQVLRKDEKNGILRLKVGDPRDVWFVSKLIEKFDVVRGTGERKIKMGSDDARKQSVVRKKMTMSVEVDKAEVEDGVLRVNGKITEAPEGIPRGDYQALLVDVGSEVEITKKEWSPLVDSYLEEAKQKGKAVLVVLFDREHALFAMLESTGPKVLFELQGNVAKKDQEGQAHGDFYEEIVVKMKEVIAREKVEQVVAASPAFWKEYLVKVLPSDLKKKVMTATCSEVSVSALSEVVRHPELKGTLEKDVSSKEEGVIEEVLIGIEQDKAAYGIVEVEEKAFAGALKNVLVTEEFIKKCKREDTIERVNAVLNAVKGAKGNVVVLRTAAAKKIDGLGGIAGLVRW